MESGESAQYVQLQALFGPSTLVPQSLELSHNTLKKMHFPPQNLDATFMLSEGLHMLQKFQTSKTINLQMVKEQ